MIGVTLGTFGIGRLIARDGPYKRYPIIGSVVSTVGLLAVAQITGTHAVLVPRHPDDLHGLRRSVGVHHHVDRQPERRRVPRPRCRHGHGHVLPVARRVVRVGRVRHHPQRNHPRRDPGTAAGWRRTRPAASSARRRRSPPLPDAPRQAVVDSVALGVSRIYWVCAACMMVAVVVGALRCPSCRCAPTPGCPMRWRGAVA